MGKVYDYEKKLEHYIEILQEEKRNFIENNYELPENTYFLARHSRAKQNKNSMNYYLKNKEKCLKRQKDHYSQKDFELKSAYYKEHKDEILEKTRQKRLEKKNAIKRAQEKYLIENQLDNIETEK